MTTFTISKAAVEDIHRIYRQSKCQDPVVRLRELSDSKGLFDDTAQEALRSASGSEERLDLEAEKRFVDRRANFFAVA